MKADKKIKPKLNKALFWDIEAKSLDYKKHARFIIGRVLLRGNFDDWIQLRDYYGMEFIKKEVVNIRYLDKLTLNFCHKIFNIPKEEFRCYNTEPSIKKLWDY